MCSTTTSSPGTASTTCTPVASGSVLPPARALTSTPTRTETFKRPSVRPIGNGGTSLRAGVPARLAGPGVARNAPGTAKAIGPARGGRAVADDDGAASGGTAARVLRGVRAIRFLLGAADAVDASRRRQSPTSLLW
jgi:hypothetical protein